MKKFVHLGTVYLFGNNHINKLNTFIKGNFLDGNGLQVDSFAQILFIF